MNRIIFSLIGLLWATCSFSQERMVAAEKNLRHFSETKYVQSEELEKFSNSENHPEYGTLPYNTPCFDCMEVIEERTQFTRKYLRLGKNGKEFLIQKGYSPLHYKNKDGQWITHDPRLKKLSSNKFAVNNQFYKIEIDTKSGQILFENKNQGFDPIVFHKNLEQELIDPSGVTLNTIKADWSNFTAGDNGALIQNIFPNIDLEINIKGPSVKTNFIVKTNVGSDFIISESPTPSTNQRILKNEPLVDQLNYFDGDKNSYRMGHIIVFDQNTQSKRDEMLLGKYRIENGKIKYTWNQDEFDKLTYPIVIDPTVTSNGTLPQASITGAGTFANFGGFTTGCTYNLSVPTPPNCEITDIDWTFTYRTIGVPMADGACKFYYNGCVSPAVAGFFWFCNDAFNQGTCAGTNVSIFGDFSACVPPPQCASYNMDFTMEFFDAWGALNVLNCDPTWVMAETDWTMTITGETVDEPAPPTSSAGLSICPGQTTTLNANGVFGVPAYSYSWSPAANLDNPNIQSPTFTAPAASGNYTYTCTITDICGETASNSITITVPNGPDAGTNGTLTMCDSEAPVDLTLSLGGTPDGGGTWAPALSAGGNTFDPSLDGSGTYTYTVPAAFGCPAASADVVVTVNNQPDAGADGNSTLCNSAGSTLDLNTLLSGADPGGTWAETTGSGQFNTGTGVFDASGLTAGTYTFTYTLTGTPPCVDDFATFDVVVSNQPEAGADGNSTLCNTAGTTIDLNTLLSGADPGGTWAETTGSGQFNTGTGVFDASGLAAGTYTFTYTITATAPCLDDFATFDIIVNDQPDAGADGNTTLCNAAGTTLDLNTLLSGADPGGTWAETTASGQFNTGTGVFDASGLTAGTYTFTYTLTAAAPCLDDFATIDVVVSDQPDAGVDGNSTLCNSAGSTIDLNTLLSGADPGGTWAETTGSGQFNTGTGVFDASGLTAGTYTFTYTLTATAPCLDDFATFDIVVSDQPDAGLDGNSTICNSAGSTIDINTLLSGADPGGTWAETTGSGQFNTGTGVLDASGLAPATYSFTYTITATAPCLDDFATFDITVTPQPEAGADGNSTLCNSAGSTIDLNTLLSGADAGGTWAETTGSGQFNTGTGVFDASGLTAGTYTFTYSFAASGSCLPDFATFDIVVNNQPDAGLDGNSTLCNSVGSTLDLNTLLSGADAGGTWTETTGSGQFNAGTGVFDASGLTAGTYTFTYTLTATAPCLDDFATFDITVTGTVTAGNDNNTTICEDNGVFDVSSLLDAGVTAGGSWTETSGTPSGQFTPGTSSLDPNGLNGTYTFLYSVAGSGTCLGDDATMTITVNSQPEAGADGNSSICNDAGATLDLNTLLSGADPGGTWAETTASGQFNTGPGVFDASGLTAGTYTFTYTLTATAPCLDDFATFDIVVSNQPEAGLDGSSTLCNSAGSSLDLNTLLSGADPGGIWAETTASGQFNAGTGVFDASGLTTGTYTFTYTLTAGAPCMDDLATFDITVTGNVTAGADNGATICSDNGAYDVSSLLDGTANAGGVWTETSGTPSGQFNAGTASLDPTGLNGTYTFQYTLAASGTCLGDDATMTITVNPAPNAGTDDNSTLCNTTGSTIDLNTLLNGADPGGTWAETSSSGQFNTGTGVFDANGLAGGAYTFTYTISGAAPCGDDVASFVINVTEQPNAGADGNATLCNTTGTNIDLNTLLVGADQGGNWTETSASGQFNAGTGVFDASGLAGGNYTFNYTVPGIAPCADDISTFTITVTPAPAAPGLSGGGTFCENDNITLNANGTGGTITWYTDPGLNNVFQTGTSATFTVPIGTTVLYVQEDNGCPGEIDSIVVIGISGPTLSVPLIVNGCEGDLLTITATSNAPLIWSTGDTTSTIELTATTDTFVVASVFTSCDTLIDTTFINVYPGFTIDAGPDQTIPLGGSTTIEATSTGLINSISWNPPTFLDCSTCTMTEVYPTQDVTYVATAIDENGCIATDNVTITLEGEITVYIPNIFSPNKDGENDDFGPYGPEFETFKMEIYNRWGGLIWQTDIPGGRWTGNHENGEQCQQGVYVYKIWGVFLTGQTFERSGTVMITR